MPAITQRLADALEALVRASDAAARAPTDRQTARRAVEAATVVVELARAEGIGPASQDDAPEGHGA